MKKILIVGGASVIGLGVFMVYTFLVYKSALQSMTLKQITPEQAAQAMKEDHFYSDYRSNTLLLKGSFSSFDSSNNRTIGTFNTSLPFQTKCELTTNSMNLKPEQQVTIITEGASAQRQQNSVLLKKCIVVS